MYANKVIDDWLSKAVAECFICGVVNQWLYCGREQDSRPTLWIYSCQACGIRAVQEFSGYSFEYLTRVWVLDDKGKVLYEFNVKKGSGEGESYFEVAEKIDTKRLEENMRFIEEAKKKFEKGIKARKFPWKVVGSEKI